MQNHWYCTSVSLDPWLDNRIECLKVETFYEIAVGWQKITWVVNEAPDDGGEHLHANNGESDEKLGAWRDKIWAGGRHGS